jgi:phosphopantothenoylcysteine decarboxylase/phosphopantothenate--cysteine ligase
MAQGFADDLLTVTALAATNPTLVAPAMDGTMYSHPAVQANLRTLYERGVYIVEPDEGRFASGLVGRGRLPETPTLLGHIRRLMGRDGVLSGHKVVISAGGTREPLDPVRYLSNRSSGKQGYALAQAALDAGADEVVLVSTADLPTPIGARLVPVESAAEMQHAVLDHGTDAGVLVMAAAVADFRPAVASPHKIKKTDDSDRGPEIELVRNPDILMAVKAQREASGYPLVVVGFAAESENLLNNAEAKLQRKGVDLLVANDISAADAGFSVDTNRVIILDADGGQQPLELLHKATVAEMIIDRAAGLLS